MTTPKSKSAQGRASRAKGHTFERFVAGSVSLKWKCNARRGIQTRDGGKEAGDVIVSLVPVHIECKATERSSPWAALRQARAEASENCYPIVIHKRNREGAVVIVDLDDFLTMTAGWAVEQQLLAQFSRTEG